MSDVAAAVVAVGGPLPTLRKHRKKVVAHVLNRKSGVMHVGKGN